MAAQDEDAPFFVEALFPFTGTDASSLSFQRGDVIHVLNRLPSGWWDGVLDDDRGWFPSNYVRIISEAEAEEIYSRRELELQQQQELRNQQEHQRQMAHAQAQARAHEQPQQQRQQTHQNVGQYSHHSQNQYWDDRTRPTGEYWEPEVTENGQIYYVNSLTGQRSREIPMEEDGEPHNPREYTQAHGNHSHMNTNQHAVNGVPIGYGRERSGTTTSQASSSRIDPISATAQRIGTEIGSYASSSAAGSNAQAFAPLHRSETPEPWQRRLTPDGQAYYYVNPITEETRWTRPEPPHGYAQGGRSDQYGYPQGAASTLTQFPPRNQTSNHHARERTNSEASYSGRERDNRRTSVYSDTSEVSPLGPDVVHQLHHLKKDVRPWPTPGAQATDGTGGKQTDSTNPLQIAITLQSQMAPPPLPPLTVYSERACEAIGAVVQAYGDPLSLTNGAKSNGRKDGEAGLEGAEGSDPSAQAEGEERTSLDPLSIQTMADRVALVVIAVRNLLYVSGTLTGSLPNLGGSLNNGINPHGAGLNGVGAGLNEDVDWVRQEIKPFQRKVTATLSKLVLSARAVNSNPDWPRLAAGGGPSAAASRVENDASELERAVTTFVYQISKSAASSRAKRLHGALMPGEGSAGIGPGLIGAGIGGGWKGAGFVPVRDGMLHNGPEIRLGREVVSELASLKRLTEDKISTLRVSVESFKVAAPAAATQGRNYDPRAADVVILNGRLTVAAISDFLMHAEEVHIATGVDVMGTAEDDDAYLASVKRARELIRMFETAKQALYDDGSVLLMASQAMHVSSLGTTTSVTKASGPADVLLQTAIPALQANLGCIMEALELLLDIAREQDEAQAQRMPQIGPDGMPPPTDYPHDRQHYRDELRRRQAEFMHPSELYDPLEDVYDRGPGAGLGDNDEVDLDYVLQPNNQRTAIRLPYGAAPEAEHRISEVPSEATTLRAEAAAPQAEPVKKEDPGADSDDSQNPTQAKRKNKAKDLKGYFGELPPEAKPGYLQLDHTGPSEIIMNPDGTVKAGTLPALVERLTMHTSPDARFNNTFMMTFKSFATIDKVFDMLVERYNIQPPEGLSQAELEEWTTEKKTPIKLRVINTMRKLIDVLEKEDLRILDRVKAFASDIITSEPERAPVAKTLLGIVQRVERNGIESKRTMHTTTSDFPPPSILPRKGGNKIKLLDIDPLELARQLTILESELFFKIKQSECIARAKDSTPAGPDNIKNVITLANQMAHWVADAVLSKEDPRRRAAVIKHFINVAERCRHLSNYSSMAALLAGLNCPPIRRLKRTWEQVNVRVTGVLDDLEATLDTAHNFQGYKAIISRRQPPCVPFLGVYLTVLTFIQDGARDTLNEGGLINFQKRQKTADVIQEITKFQMLPYNLTKLATIRQFIDESLAALPEDPDFWQLSLEREPREREDEKMARLLQESGFL